MATEKNKEIDPKFYQNVDINNPQRLKRCYEIYIATGKKLSSFHKKKKKREILILLKLVFTLKEKNCTKKLTSELMR